MSAVQVDQAIQVAGPARPLWIRVGTLLSAVAFVGYPLAVYLGEGRGRTRLIGIALMALGLFRVLSLRQGAGPSSRMRVPAQRSGSSGGRSAAAAPEAAKLTRGVVLIGAAAVVALALWAIVADNEETLLYVPSLWNAAGSAAFFSSLVFTRESWVEILARASHGVDELPPIARRYCRRVTGFWGSFLLLNATICAALAAFGPVSLWALYTGVIGYVLVGLLMAIEYVYRITRVKPRADREAEALGLDPAS